MTEPLERFQRELKDQGFDLNSSFDVTAHTSLFTETWARACLPSWVHERLSQERPLWGIVVGNTSHLWAPFLKWYRTHPAISRVSDPLDAYVEESMSRALVHLSCQSGDSPRPRCWLGFAHQVEPSPLPIQRLAEASGLASLGPSGLVVHDEYGPWMGLRALVLVETALPWRPVARKTSPCQGCQKPCLAPFERALRGGGLPVADEVHPPVGHPVASLSDNARVWLAVRDACPVGRNHRYGSDQLVYHYDKDRAALSQKPPLG